jgi:uncharacterized membrane protein (DUF4010 family)
MDTLIQQLPGELSGFILTLALSLLIGFEREEHDPDGPGGVRTFPIIGLSGFLLATAFPDSPIPFAAGLIVLGLLVALTHWATVHAGEGGITTEVTAILTFTIGGAAASGFYWISIASGILAVILLQEKTRLETWATRIPTAELRTLAHFLVLTAVILPAVPNRSFTAFQINPFKIWVVVVAVSGISYLSYLLRRFLPGDHGLLLTGLIGGIYSSTATTVALARASKGEDERPLSYVGAIVAATGMMYVRLWVLVALFAPPIARELVATFWIMGCSAVAIGAFLCWRQSRSPATTNDSRPRDGSTVATNPLEITSALAFAFLFVAVLVITRLVAARFGGTGVLVLAAIMGTTDVDPFILGLTQAGTADLPIRTAALAVVVATAANNAMKGVYARAFAPPLVGWAAFGILTTLGVISLGLFFLI